MTSAFTSSVHPCLLRNKSAALGLDSLRGPTQSTAVARRRRVVAVDGLGDNPSETPASDDRSELSSSDTDASDLALPDLRALFEASGDPDCEQCTGNGIIPCAVCQAKGFVTITMMDTVSSSQCRLCKGKKKIPCPSCRAEVYKSVLWWDLIPSEEEDPEEKWRDGPDGPRIRWNNNPAGPA